jgi:hypothetical protein
MPFLVRVLRDREKSTGNPNHLEHREDIQLHGRLAPGKTVNCKSAVPPRRPRLTLRVLLPAARVRQMRGTSTLIEIGKV